MTDQELLERSKNLQSEAFQIIERLQLIEILKKYSEPEIVGSVAHNLMVLSDIDIHCYTKNPNLDDVTEIMKKLVFMPTVQMVHFNNYLDLRRDHRQDRIDFPHGYYLGFRSIQPSGEWKIDMWFKEKNDPKEYDASALKALTKEQRIAILRFKEQFKQGKGYKDGAISTDFYRAVLEKGITTEEEFSKYLLNKI